jgi:purine-binding chemotaxis protein CheW
MTATRRRAIGEIDWQGLRQRLAGAAAATEEALRLSRERARAVMDERARILARVPAAPPQAGDVLDVVTFALANERYGIEARYVREIVRLVDFTPVPGVPDFIIGLVNLRGEILVVVDLRRFLGVTAKGLTDLSRVIVLGSGHAEFGVLADEVHEVTTLRVDEAHEPPESVVGVGRAHLRGVTEHALILLNGAVLLNDARLFVDQGPERN